MLDRASLGPALSTLKAAGVVSRFDDFAYRSIALKYFAAFGAASPLYAATAGVVGTRYVIPDAPIPSLYLAFDAETAHREGNQSFYQTKRLPGASPATLKPAAEVVVIGVAVGLAAILDVRDDGVRAALGTTAAELVGPWKGVADAPTQRLGAAIEADGEFEGLIDPSAQHPGGTCLVVYPVRLRRGSFVEFRSRTPGLTDARLGPR